MVGSLPGHRGHDLPAGGDVSVGQEEDDEGCNLAVDAPAIGLISVVGVTFGMAARLNVYVIE